jgi:hypothetical protein
MSNPKREPADRRPLRELVEKWRVLVSTPGYEGIAVILEQCADELAAALAEGDAAGPPDARCRNCGCRQWEHEPETIRRAGWKDGDQQRCICGACPAWEVAAVERAALPLTDYVRLFLEKLPDMNPPEAWLDPDGDVGFDWDLGRGAVLSASIRGDGRVAWAGLIGDWKATGNFLLPAWPDDFVDALKRIDARAALPPAPAPDVQERLDAATAQLLIELAFLLPKGTDVMKHPIAAKLIEFRDAVRVAEASALARPRTPAPAGQPIETAPKDGTWLIATDGTSVGRYRWANGWTNAQGWIVHTLTHWIPLPPTAEASTLPPAPAPDVTVECPCGHADAPWHWPRHGLCQVGINMRVAEASALARPRTEDRCAFVHPEDPHGPCVKPAGHEGMHCGQQGFWWAFK